MTGGKGGGECERGTVLSSPLTPSMTQIYREHDGPHYCMILCIFANSLWFTVHSSSSQNQIVRRGFTKSIFCDTLLFRLYIIYIYLVMAMSSAVIPVLAGDVNLFHTKKPSTNIGIFFFLIGLLAWQTKLWGSRQGASLQPAPS